VFEELPSNARIWLGSGMLALATALTSVGTIMLKDAWEQSAQKYREKLRDAEVEVYFGDTLRAKAVEIPFKSFSDLLPKTVEARSTIPTTRLRLKNEQTSITISVIIRNNGEKPITNAAIKVLSNLPITSPNTSAKTFSNEQLSIEIASLGRFEPLGEEHFLSLTLNTSDKDSDWTPTILVTGDGIKGYVAIAHLSFRRDE
jgi:hypothetical protein